MARRRRRPPHGLPRRPAPPSPTAAAATATGLVLIQPPAGLLDLGRQQLLLATLRQELAPFTTPPPLSLLARMGLRVMPSARQLAEAGRQDLVAAIKRAGGFLEVAQASSTGGRDLGHWSGGNPCMAQVRPPVGACEPTTIKAAPAALPACLRCRRLACAASASRRGSGMRR